MLIKPLLDALKKKHKKKPVGGHKWDFSIQVTIYVIFSKIYSTIGKPVKITHNNQTSFTNNIS